MRCLGKWELGLQRAKFWGVNTATAVAFTVRDADLFVQHFVKQDEFDEVGGDRRLVERRWIRIKRSVGW